MNNYLLFSRSKYYSVVSALPLLVVYEILVILTQSRYWSIRNAADMWIRTFLMAFELRAQHLTIVMIGIAILLIPISKIYSPGVKLKVKFFIVMLGESFCYSIILGGLLHSILRLGGLVVGSPGFGPLQTISL